MFIVFTIKTPIIIKAKPIIVGIFGICLYLKIPSKDKATIPTPDQVAYVIPIGKTLMTWDIVYMQIIIATTHTNEGINFVKPSVALRVPVEIISPAIAIAKSIYAWAKDINTYTFWQNKDLVLS